MQPWALLLLLLMVHPALRHRGHAVLASVLGEPGTLTAWLGAWEASQNWLEQVLVWGLLASLACLLWRAAVDQLAGCAGRVRMRDQHHLGGCEAAVLGPGARAGHHMAPLAAWQESGPAQP